VLQLLVGIAGIFRIKKGDWRAILVGDMMYQFLQNVSRLTVRFIGSGLHQHEETYLFQSVTESMAESSFKFYHTYRDVPVVRYEVGKSDPEF
jgi:hypothetical protein